MTYLYETIPLLPGDEVKQYEIEQSMKDDALKRHPETGEPIRRIILGGWGLIGGKSKGGGKSSKGGGKSSKGGGKSSKGGCGCGPGGCC